MFFSSLRQGDFTARLTAVWADDGTPCKRFVSWSGPRIPTEKPDPMVSAHPIWWLSSLHIFLGSTLASTSCYLCFCRGCKFFFSWELSSYIFLLSSISTLGWCVIFLVALLGSFLQWHPWKAHFFSLNFDCVVSLSMSFKFCLCFVFMPMLCACGSSSSSFFPFSLCCCGSAAAVSDSVGVAFLLLHPNCHPNKSLERPRQGKMTVKNHLQNRNFCHYG